MLASEKILDEMLKQRDTLNVIKSDVRLINSKLEYINNDIVELRKETDTNTDFMNSVIGAVKLSSVIALVVGGTLVAMCLEIIH